MSIKGSLQGVFDELQFHFDLFPRPPYQPLPWIGHEHALRATGTEERWKAIERALIGVRVESAMDIGCNVGYFTFAMAERGIPTLGIEMDDRHFRVARHIARKLRNENVALCCMKVSNESASLLPRVDAVLLLSVWHHWVRYFGLPAATTLLASVWERCNKVMFFETGEEEMTPEFALPLMGPCPRQWLADYLKETCRNAEIIHQGGFKAFAPGGGEEKKIVFRNLFKVVRSSN